ncbi:MAG: MBL fold metallo-hydrolase [Eubacteriaceae bacterium]|nr:MBL fold metallo-hydrolase [Eubacteriaceae bacterium]
MKIAHQANTGFLLTDELNGKKVLIDAIHTAEVKPYKKTDDQTLFKMIEGVPPFDNIDLLLYTHYHEDHFDGRNTLRFLKNNGNTKLFSTSQTLELLRSNEEYDILLEPRLLSAELANKETRKFTIDRITFECTPLIHDGKEYQDVINFCYTLHMENKKIFHCGDAQPSELNYQQTAIPDLGITDALLDFPYVTLTAGRKVVQNYIKPEKIYIMHLPEESEDSYGWLNTVNKVVERYKEELPSVELCY